MEIAPLALVVLLGYGLLIALSLTTWTAVAYFREESAGDHRQREPERSPVERERSRSKRAVSNDEVRGARSRRARGGDDPFRGETGTAARSAPAGSGGGASVVTARRSSPGGRPAEAATAPAAGAVQPTEGPGTPGEAGTTASRGGSRSGVPRKSAGASSSAAEAGRPRGKRQGDDEEDAFERFLSSRSDDLDIR